LRGGVQRGPIKGLDAAAQMRYTPQNRSPCFSNRSPCFSLLTTQHTQNHSKLIIVSDKWLESPTRASVRVAVLLSLSVQSCNIHPVYPRQRSRLNLNPQSAPPRPFLCPSQVRSLTCGARAHFPFLAGMAGNPHHCCSNDAIGRLHHSPKMYNAPLVSTSPLLRAGVSSNRSHQCL